jgi:hypothetical protein
VAEERVVVPDRRHTVPLEIQGSGLRVEVPEFRDQDSRFRVQGSGFKV